MLFLQWCYIGLFSLLLPIIYALPVSRQQDYSSVPDNYFVVDIHSFSSIYSTHLSFDHLDGTLSSLSKAISLHFQKLIQVTAQPFDLNDTFTVDVELLKGQLQGAVGSFIEDSMPTIWNTRAAVIDKANLSIYIEQVIMQYCYLDQNIINNTCIENNAHEIVSTVDHYIQQHLLNIITLIVMQDLPPLFETTQSHVNSILAHFGHYLNRKASTINTGIVMHHSFENIDDLTVHLQSAIKLYHSSLEKLTLDKYTLLARVN